MSPGRRLRGALGDSVAQTDPTAPDPELRGRTYAVPFEDVWAAAIALANGGLRGCSLKRANDRDGIIIAGTHIEAVGHVPSVR